MRRSGWNRGRRAEARGKAVLGARHVAITVTRGDAERSAAPSQDRGPLGNAIELSSSLLSLAPCVRSAVGSRPLPRLTPNGSRTARWNTGHQRAQSSEKDGSKLILGELRPEPDSLAQRAALAERGWTRSMSPHEAHSHQCHQSGDQGDGTAQAAASAVGAGGAGGGRARGRAARGGLHGDADAGRGGAAARSGGPGGQDVGAGGHCGPGVGEGRGGRGGDDRALVAEDHRGDRAGAVGGGRDQGDGRRGGEGRAGAGSGQGHRHGTHATAAAAASAAAAAPPAATRGPGREGVGARIQTTGVGPRAQRADAVVRGRRRPGPADAVTIDVGRADGAQAAGGGAGDQVQVGEGRHESGVRSQQAGEARRHRRAGRHPVSGTAHRSDGGVGDVAAADHDVAARDDRGLGSARVQEDVGRRRGDEGVVERVQGAVVGEAALRPEQHEARAVPARAAHLADHDVADHHRVAVRGGGVGGVDHADLAVLRIGDAVVEQGDEVRPGLDVLPEQRVVDEAATEGHAPAADVDVVAEARERRRAVVVDLAAIDQQAVVAVGLDAHVVAVEPAVAHGDARDARARHAHARTIVAVARVGELQVLDHHVAAFDLEDRARVRPRAIDGQAGGVEHRAGGAQAADGDRAADRAGGRPAPHLVVGAGVDLDHVARSQGGQRGEGGEGLAGADLVGGRLGEPDAGQQGEEGDAGTQGHGDLRPSLRVPRQRYHCVPDPG